MTTSNTANRRRITAAVVRDKGGAFQVEQASIGEPGPREVLVRVVATGVCHTDIIIRDQYYPSPLPAVLGHEGLGVVEAIGSDVRSVAPGDDVVMAFISCGFCRSCEQGHTAHCEDFFALNFGGVERTAPLLPATVMATHCTTISLVNPYSAVMR